MSALEAVVAAQPGWAWLALAAALLAAETATGSGYLLWPSAAAGAVGLLLLAGAPLSPAAQATLFAAATVAATLAARRWWPRRPRGEGAPDLINDTGRRLIGHEGRVVADGRVFVDGKEWAAEWDGGTPPPGGVARVVAVVGGARLRMRAE